MAVWLTWTGTSGSGDARRGHHGFVATRSAGMIVLAIYLTVVGLAGLVALAVPLPVTAVLASSPAY